MGIQTGLNASEHVDDEGRTGGYIRGYGSGRREPLWTRAAVGVAGQ